MINNRQAGRRRGRGGNNPNGQRQGGNPGRPDTGNRIDSRARGNASQLYEKYKNLASDAQRQGDRVNTEYYLQFADHYFRVLSEQRGRFEEQQPRRARDDFDFDGDDDYMDEGEPVRPGEQAGDVPRVDARMDQRGADQRVDAGGDDGDERPRDGQRRDARPREGGDQPRAYGDGRGRDAFQQRDGSDQPRQPRDGGDRSRQQRVQGDQPRQPRDATDGARAPRDGADQPRQQRDMGDQPRAPRDTLDEGRAPRDALDEGRAPRDGAGQPDAGLDREPRRQRDRAPVEVAGQRRADPPIAGESLDGRAEAVLEADAPLDVPAPRRRGRPRREVAEAPAEPSGFEADRLPPSLSSMRAVNDGEGGRGADGVGADDGAGKGEVKPRRRRARPTADVPAAE